VNRRIRLLLILTGVAAITFAHPAVTAAQEAAVKVAEVRVQGNKRISAASILTDVSVRVGATYDPQVIDADRQRLLKSGRFDSVAVTRTPSAAGVILTFVVVERAVVAKIIFSGNKAFGDAELAKELTFNAGDALNPVAVESGRRDILGKYQTSGYHFAEVSLDREALKRYEVIYTVVEGPQVTVRKVVFDGNRHFGNLRLRRQIGTAARLWPIFPGRLKTDLVEQDVVAIRNLYLSEGFLDVEVDRELEFSDDKHSVRVTFIINEGPRFRVNRFIFRGNTVFADEELARRIAAKAGLGKREFFTALRLRRSIEAVRDSYGELGYIEATVRSRNQFLAPDAALPPWARKLKEKPGLLNVVFEITEADQYRIGRITIRGNEVTQGRVIRRQLSFYPEQLFNTVAVEQSRRRLIESGLFEKVTLMPTGRTPKVRDVLVQVQDRRTGEFMIGGGLNTNEGLVGLISLTERNFDIARWPRSWKDVAERRAFRGAGQTFRIAAEPGLDLMRFSVEWVEPAVMDKPYKLGVKAFLFQREWETYDETRFGGVVSLGHRFKNRWYGELAMRMVGVDVSELTSDAPLEVRGDSGTSTLVGLKGTLVRDRTDSRWRPSTGDRFLLSYEQVGGDYVFGAAKGDYRIYRTLYRDSQDRKHILAGRVSTGYLCGDSPVFERFYGGGIGSIRGFSYRGISPRGAGSDEQIGGEFMFLARTEYEFPLFRKQLRGVVFLDTGTVERTVEVTTYRAAAGFGLKLRPELGPVLMSLNFGFPLTKAGQDDTEIFSWSLGFRF